mmetsp:Transcript_128766/g.287856  ORF Transcript_128766/g.287856 Transcript_128766/m.287856 type:complete len:235 (-) Transcript_128766:7-711(-)
MDKLAGLGAALAGVWTSAWATKSSASLTAAAAAASPSPLRPSLVASVAAAECSGKGCKDGGGSAATFVSLSPASCPSSFSTSISASCPTSSSAAAKAAAASASVSEPGSATSPSALPTPRSSAFSGARRRAWRWRLRGAFEPEISTARREGAPRLLPDEATPAAATTAAAQRAVRRSQTMVAPPALRPCLPPAPGQRSCQGAERRRATLSPPRSARRQAHRAPCATPGPRAPVS